MYYTKESKKKFQELIEVSGIKNYEIIPEYIATGLTYGFENNNQYLINNKESEILMIIEIGYIGTNCSIIKYTKNKMEVLSKSHMIMGGREIDKLLIEYVYNKIKEKESNVNNIDEDIRLYWKLESEVINGKEKLSADGADSVIINIDGYYKDNDFEMELTVKDIDDVVKKLEFDKKLHNIMEECFKISNIRDDEKELFEIVIIGGSLRIPYLKSEVLNFLTEKNGKTRLKQTLNMESPVSLGCGYYYEILSKNWNYEIICNDNVLKNSYLLEEIDDKITNTYNEEKEMEEYDENRKKISSYLNEIETKMYNSFKLDIY